MNILITGATGFVGNAVLQYYHEKIDKRDQVFLMSSRPVDGYPVILHKNYTFSTEELPQPIDCLLCIAGYVPKTVEQRNNGFLHAFAVSSLQYLLDRLPNVPKKIVLCSSVDVYGRNNGEKIISEADPAYVYDYYSAQKLMCEGIAEEYARRTGAACTILRLGPMFGERDLRREFFLPGIIYKAASNETITLKAHPTVKRNYIYVKDSAKAIWHAVLGTQPLPGIINIVSKNNITMDEIIRTAMRVTNSKSEYIIEPGGSLTAGQMMFDDSLMEQFLCAEDYTLESAMRETYQYISKEEHA